MKCACLCLAGLVPSALQAQTQPLVAIHDSELTRALEVMPATGATPKGAGTTGFQWWPTDWHYFVMPEALKEGLHSDGTAFTVVSDSNISAGALLTNGLPKYPIVISLASEAIRNDEIAQLTNYVAAGGFLFVGASAFTRNTNGTTRGDFAFANDLGVHMVVSGLTNWTQNNTFTKQVDHRLISHFPSGSLTHRLPASSEEIPWGISPSHPFLEPHDIWQVSAGDATVIATGDSLPYLLVKPYGKGYFIYHAAFQPLIGHSGFAPGMYAYGIFRKAIEWAFQSANLAVPKLSPWPYPYDAAFMIRHDLENFTNEIAAIAASAQIEFTNGARGDYYFCTGTLRDDASPTYDTNAMIAGLRQAVTNYGATIGPHNGGLRNPNNPALVRGQYDYWHWGPDEALDVTPPGYASGKAYAMASMSNSFVDIEHWLSGITNGLRAWCACYFNGTREASYDIQSQLNVKITGEQKLTPWPHWTVSTQTSGKRYVLSEPVSDWFVNGLVAQSLEPWHPPGVQTSQTMHDGVDFYYNMGALINFYSHTLSTGLGGAGQLTPDYLTYSLNTNFHPRIWSANAVSVYQWWLQRSNAQITATSSTNGLQSIVTISVSGATDPNTTVEILVPYTNNFCSLQVLTNGVLAAGNSYRTNGQVVKVRVGTSVTNTVISYYPLSSSSQVFSQNFDGVTAPGLPSGWTTSATGAQAPWVTQTTNSDTPPNAAFSIDATNIGLNELDSPPIALPVGTTQLSFQNYYDLETGGGSIGYDGGVLEIKIGTNAYTDILAAGGGFATGGYTSTISTNYGNPLAGRQAWSGNSAGFVITLVNLPASAAGQTVQFRWRCGTDNANGRSGWRIDTVAIASTVCFCCSGTNTPPVLPAQTNRTSSGTASIVVTNTASDTDFPPETLSYQLVSPPVGAGIDANGVIAWTPAVSQVPSTNLITTIVTDSGLPPLSATNSFTITVNAIHNGPVLPAQTNRTINEMTTLTVTNTASDSDMPPLQLTYTLQSSSPTNAAISNNGIITWTPTEAQVASTNLITTVVTDNGTPPLSATNTFTVLVNDLNFPPAFLGTPPNRTIAPLTTLSVTNNATDPDLSATLTYSLLIAPTNASIGTNNGVITWTPAQEQDQSTNVFTTVVTDFDPLAVNSQHLSATNSFTVIVNGHAVLVVDTTALLAEGCYPTNNAIDPGETVTVLFSVKDIGLGNTTNLVATLLTNSSVISPSGPQTFGVLLSGGADVSQPFTFTANGGCGSNITANLQMQDGSLNLGTASVSFVLGPVVLVSTQNFDSVTAPALPAGWATVATGYASNWVTETTNRDTLPNAAFSTDATNIGLNELDSAPIVLPNGVATLAFKNWYDLEDDITHPTNGFDGGVLELKVGTNAYIDIVAAGGSFVSGGYTATINTNFGNPLAGRMAWSGNTGGFTNTVVSLPTSAQGQTVQFRWRCGTDNGVGKSGWRIDSIGITGYSCCARTPPLLPLQTNRTIAGLSTLIVTNTATDVSVPSNSLTYSLVAPPGGAQIDTNGVITWTPVPAQVPSTNLFTTVVTDNGTPALSATNSFTVIVQAVHNGPVLPAQTNRTIIGLATLVVTNTASDNDIPATALTYALSVAPTNAVIDANGVITWTPVMAQVPSTNLFTTVVTDNGTPALSATNSITVIVQAVHNGPVLPAQANRATIGLAKLVVTNTANDNDIPATVLTYTLTVAPTNVVIDSNG
ncbi:MAG TPA: hypothetical protein VN578_04945, partial [Candidatus Binatia bacterium]|nr:hypothetical protein [Candidatus Binatia bacterium]